LVASDRTSLLLLIASVLELEKVNKQLCYVLFSN
jgi:hypothetical protein